MNPIKSTFDEILADYTAQIRRPMLHPPDLQLSLFDIHGWTAPEFYAELLKLYGEQLEQLKKGEL